MLDLNLHLLSLPLLVLLLLSTWAFLRRSLRPPYPPGPYRWPIIGNALEYPKENVWLKFSEWSKQYGDIVFLKVLGLPITIIHSQAVAKELFDKRWSTYSDRPPAPMAELSGYTQAFSFMAHGDEWRAQRKLVAPHFTVSAVTRYHSIQEEQARKLVIQLLDEPNKFDDYIKLRIADIITRVAFGFHLTGEDDIFYTRPVAIMDHFVQAANPGVWMVDMFPFLRYLPKWAPGTHFLSIAAEWAQEFRDSNWASLNRVIQSTEAGTVLTPNVCTDILNKKEGPLSESEKLSLSFAAGAILGGGLDTNMSLIRTCVLLLLHHRSIQTKVYEEIVKVVGTDRLPNIADRPSLPYLRSVITEAMRFHPSATIGVPHCTNKDDIYNGMLIPKGSVVLANVWHMFHDPEIYPDPNEFKPERYNNSEPEMLKVYDALFGFGGRRVCPGVSFAEGTVFAIISTVLATCEILPPLDREGNEAWPPIAFNSEPLSSPKPFGCRLKCRSEESLRLLQATIIA